MYAPFKDEIAKRLGVLPNFFQLAATEPEIGENLWGFAQFAYLDNALPSLFKERLVVYLSRFCENRYCIARHVGFLTGLGYPAGDSSCPPQTVESILPLLRRSLPHGDELLPLLNFCDELESPLSSFPAPDSLGEQAIFACASHVFLQTVDSQRAHQALSGALGPVRLEQLNLLLAFVRTAQYWTGLHPELALDEDVERLLAANDRLSECILQDPEAQREALHQHLAAELASFRKLRHRLKGVTRAYQGLSLDHEDEQRRQQESEAALHELVAAIPAAIYACNTGGILTYVNRKASELWGTKPGLGGTPWSFVDSVRLCDRDGVLLPAEKSPIRTVLTTGAPISNREFILERPDSARINVLANVAPLRDASGAVTGAVCILQDISHLRRALRDSESSLRELERSNRELAQFPFAVSHDLLSPVRSVRALTQILVRREGGLQDETSHLLTLIERASTGMERLIESLLRYAQAGHGHLECQRVPVAQIIESVRVSLGALIDETGARIVCKSLPVVEADPTLLEHLFQNLIGNALRYHRPGEAPVVEISAENRGDTWEFAVKDNGQGIPLKRQEFVFEPLKRLHGSETPGTGLGLALCRTIAARHGGRIWVESEGEGKGATFRFTLPATQSIAAIARTAVN